MRPAQLLNQSRKQNTRRNKKAGSTQTSKRRAETQTSKLIKPKIKIKYKKSEYLNINYIYHLSTQIGRLRHVSYI